MRVALVFSILVAILAVVFALQNPTVVDLSIGPFQLRGALAVVLLITFGSGILVGILATVPKRFRSRNRIKLLERQLDAALNPDVQEQQVVGDPLMGVPATHIEPTATEPSSADSSFAPPGLR